MRRSVYAAAAAGAALLVVVVLVPMMMLVSVLGAGGGRAAASSGSMNRCVLGDSGATIRDLDKEQIANARIIIAVGKALDVPPRGWVVAIATALQESGLRNVHYGDRDSQGLMQQRPSAGWGTVEQVTSPEYAARAFYGGPQSPTNNTGLLDIPHWQTMPLWQAAQSVQRSAFPMAYADHEALATRIVQDLAGRTPGCQRLQDGSWGLPVAVNYTLTSGFGPRTSPTRGGADFHTGQDFAVPIGTKALAVSAGTVIYTHWGGGYGNLVKVRHAHGVESWYAHLSHISVNVGDRVHRGSVLGLTGSTGNSTGPHLHLEIRADDKPTDPLPWLRKKGVRQ